MLTISLLEGTPRAVDKSCTLEQFPVVEPEEGCGLSPREFSVVGVPSSDFCS